MDDDRQSKAGIMICGEVVGGMSVGKAAALQEWSWKREKRDFAVLVNRLRVRKWQKENPEKRAQKCARYTAKPAVKQAQLERQRKARLNKARKNPTVFRCEMCGVEWCKAPWVKGPSPSFCGGACYQRHRYASDESFREQRKAASRLNTARARQDPTREG